MRALAAAATDAARHEQQTAYMIFIAGGLLMVALMCAHAAWDAARDNRRRGLRRPPRPRRVPGMDVTATERAAHLRTVLRSRR
ncbi:hypothetical protein QWY28_17180 [Nocardioides sp. SOB77]|uniref:Uncharacterized protein n=1 Tax=Nocardioides oceani TaxID=3058369 RepID=A0ABT8FJ42_9ACTN|nr:hypothetical protein [Nocardioides oceani]MDN4174698.1 hypothetical protein [Nocardioides oceani]